VDDNLVEGDETIVLEGSAEGFEIASAELTVTDNDVMPTSITLSVDVSSFDEGTGGEATVSAVLGDGSTALLVDTQVALSVAEGEDNAAAEATLTIPAGETQGSASLELSPVDDNLVEGDETIGQRRGIRNRLRRADGDRQRRDADVHHSERGRVQLRRRDRRRGDRVGGFGRRQHRPAGRHPGRPLGGRR
jgi:hypothetical protein